MQGENGHPDAVIACSGQALSLALHNVNTPFHNTLSMDLSDTAPDLPPGLTASVIDNGKYNIGISDKLITIDDRELNSLMLCLAELRLNSSKVPLEIDGARTIAQIDPVWRTQKAFHPNLNGILLNLRHTGYGWVSFVLPHAEAKNLGRWLFENADFSSKEEK